MPLLETHLLQSHRELRLAHLALSTLTMGYVWQEGERETVKVYIFKVLSSFEDPVALIFKVMLVLNFFRSFHEIWPCHYGKCPRDCVYPQFSPTLIQFLPTGRKQTQMGKLNMI